MKRILNYILAWDYDKKTGYLTATDEDAGSHVFADLGKDEFKIMLDLMKEEKVFIDRSNWIVAGWKPENESKKKLKL